MVRDQDKTLAQPGLTLNDNMSCVTESGLLNVPLIGTFAVEGPNWSKNADAITLPFWSLTCATTELVLHEPPCWASSATLPCTWWTVATHGRLPLDGICTCTKPVGVVLKSISLVRVVVDGLRSTCQK